MNIVQIGAADLRFPSESSTYSIEQILVHPRKHFQDYNDIALIKLHGKVDINENSRPACLFQFRNLYNVEFKIIGYGQNLPGTDFVFIKVQ